MVVPELQQAQPMAPRQHSGGHHDWATAKLGSAGSDSSFALPLTAWRLGSGPEGADQSALRKPFRSFTVQCSQCGSCVM